MKPPLNRVDHVSVAVPHIDEALEFFLKYFPAEVNEPRQPGYDDDFHWADFTIGDFKIELIDSARSGSFVERFLDKRGPGFHHLSLDVDQLDPLIDRLEQDGFRIVDRFEEGPGHKTAFIHPKSAFGTLVQFWQGPDHVPDPAARPGWGGIVEKNGTRWQVDHLALALESIDPAVEFFSNYLGARIEVEKHPGYDRTFDIVQMRLGDYRLELMDSSAPDGFLRRFLSKRGEGMHHISIDVEDLEAAIAPFERDGFRIVDRFDFAPGWRTAFLHPKSAFGILIQFWQMPIDDWSQRPAV